MVELRVLTIKRFATALLAVVGFFAVHSAHAQVVPSDSTSTSLIANCSASVASNGTITWNASSTGGIAPYSYVWSGDSLINGNTATSVASAYSNAGLHQATLQATDADGNTATTNCSASITGISNAQGIQFAGLQMGFFVTNPTPTEGDEVDYGVIVIAIGPATSTGVTAVDKLPTGVTFAGATASQGSYASSTGIWTIGDMAPNTRANLDISVTPNAGTHGQILTNTATVSEDAALINEVGPTSVSESILVQLPTSTVSAVTLPIINNLTSTATSTLTAANATIEAEIQSLFLQIQQLASLIGSYFHT